MAYTADMESFRHLIISLLLLLYMGQSLAAVAMPCFTTDSAPDEMSNPMAGMAHPIYHMASEELTVGGSERCCDSDSLCPMSQCQTLVVLTVATISGAATYSAVHNDAPLFSPLDVSSGSLYRPPISL